MPDGIASLTQDTDMPLTETQLHAASEFLYPGSTELNPVAYEDLVRMWDNENPVPTEAELEQAWIDFSVEDGVRKLGEKATLLIEGVTGDTKQQLDALMNFAMNIYGHLKGNPASMGSLDAQYNATVPPIVAIQTHKATLVAALDASNVGSLDVEAGTLDGVTGTWPGQS